MLKYLLIAAVGCGGSEPSKTSSGGGNQAGGGSQSQGGGSGATGGSGTVSRSESETQGLSGSRLKVTYLLGDDGSKSFTSFFDSSRSEQCVFVNASDGAMRCLPLVGEFASPYSFYADAACTVEYAVTSSNCAGTPKYAVSPGVECPTRWHLFALDGAGMSVPATFYALGSDGACAAMPSSPTTQTFYTMGAEVAASLFVAGTGMMEQ